MNEKKALRECTFVLKIILNGVLAATN